MSLVNFLLSHWMLSSLFIVFLLGYIAFEWRLRYVGPKRLTPQAAVALINQQQPLLLDLREKSKYDQGHILDARQCAQTELEATLKNLKVSADKPILLVCQQGQAASVAGTQLKKLGFTEVYQLAGGIQAWMTAELPLHK